MGSAKSQPELLQEVALHLKRVSCDSFVDLPRGQALARLHVAHLLGCARYLIISGIRRWLRAQGCDMVANIEPCPLVNILQHPAKLLARRLVTSRVPHELVH